MTNFSPVDDLQGYLLDAIAGCWMKTHSITEGIMSDTFEELLRSLRDNALSGRIEIIQIVDRWSPDEMWNKLRGRFGAREYPFGVMLFAKEFLTQALQRRDSLSMSLPSMVNLIETTLGHLESPELARA